MGQRRDYNPKMDTEWSMVAFPRRDDDTRQVPSPWRAGAFYLDHSAGWRERASEAVAWCEGDMIHGRFAKSNGNVFYFKGKRDAMAFKLAWA